MRLVLGDQLAERINVRDLLHNVSILGDAVLDECELVVLHQKVEEVDDGTIDKVVLSAVLFEQLDDRVE